MFEDVGSKPDFYKGFENDVSVINLRFSTLSNFEFYKASKSIVAFSKILMCFPDIHELEINPLIVLERGKGCRVVDSRMRLRADRNPPPTVSKGL